MNETELVEKLERPDWQGPIDRELIRISDGRKATTLIRRLQVENEALRVKQAGLVEALRPLVDAAYGLSFGEDWNNGTQAKLHGHRQKLIDAVPRARAALSRVNE
jgi:hypothetical protein